MHANTLVVDGSRAFVGSANLTHRALSATIAPGCVIEDPDVAEAIEEHVVGPIGAGTIVRVDGAQPRVLRPVPMLAERARRDYPHAALASSISQPSCSADSSSARVT